MGGEGDLERDRENEGWVDRWRWRDRKKNEDREEIQRYRIEGGEGEDKMGSSTPHLLECVLQLYPWKGSQGGWIPQPPTLG